MSIGYCATFFPPSDNIFINSSPSTVQKQKAAFNTNIPKNIAIHPIFISIKTINLYIVHSILIFAIAIIITNIDCAILPIFEKSNSIHIDWINAFCGLIRILSNSPLFTIFAKWSNPLKNISDIENVKYTIPNKNATSKKLQSPI